jgi:hypothetical protein
MNLFDIYVLAGARNSTVIKRFLERFAAGAIQARFEYEIPQYCDTPSMIFSKADEVMEYLCEHSIESQSIYYRLANHPDKIKNAMVFFTNDGHIIFGLSVYLSDASESEKYLKAMAVTVDARYGYFIQETPPPPTAVEFIAIVKATDYLPKLCLEPFTAYSMPGPE